MKCNRPEIQQLRMYQQNGSRVTVVTHGCSVSYLCTRKCTACWASDATVCTEKCRTGTTQGKYTGMKNTGLANVWQMQMLTLRRSMSYLYWNISTRHSHFNDTYRRWTLHTTRWTAATTSVGIMTHRPTSNNQQTFIHSYQSVSNIVNL